MTVRKQETDAVGPPEVEILANHRAGLRVQLAGHAVDARRRRRQRAAGAGAGSFAMLLFPCGDKGFQKAALDPARREDSHAVRIDQHLREHDRVVRRIPRFFLLVGRRNRRQIQVITKYGIGSALRRPACASGTPRVAASHALPECCGQGFGPRRGLVEAGPGTAVARRSKRTLTRWTVPL